MGSPFDIWMFETVGFRFARRGYLKNMTPHPHVSHNQSLVFKVATQTNVKNGKAGHQILVGVVPY